MTEYNWLGDNQLSLDIWKNKYRHKDETFEQWLDRVSGGNEKIKQLIQEKKFLFGGRTLANRGIPDSGSFSNCYSIGYVPDSLEGIMDVATKIALTFKAQGGQGLSLSNIRPKGSLIRGQFPSDGIVPFMNIFNTVTDSISQGGSRKGALMMSLDAKHPEIETFIKIKEDPNAITKANLSVEVDDEFMQCVLEDIDIARHYDGVNRNEKDEFKFLGEYYPIKTFNTICESAWKSAEPGILFTNRLRNYNLMEYVDEYQVETTNPCGEQPLPKHGACNLCSINVSEYVKDPYTEKAEIDWNELLFDTQIITWEMDRVLEENAERHALPEQREMALKYRNIGIGIMGLADLFVKLGIKYGSEESLKIANTLMRRIFRTAVDSSVERGARFGNFPGYSAKVWDSNIMRNAFTEAELDFLKLKGCLRNCSLISIAPTGSIGTMLNISTGVEPFFALSYNRKTVSMKGETYKVDIKAVEEYRKVTGDTNNVLPDYFVTAQDIPWKERIDMQAALQEFCDTAISSTVNLPRETTVEDVKELYKYAWKKGLKGVTIYREGSRDPILSVKEEEKPEILPIQLPNPHELQRGEIIKPGDHWLGLKRTLVTGCGTLHVESFWDPETGELRECYLSKGSTGGCNNFMIGLSRMMSLAARGGVSVENIIDQLKSCGTCPAYAVRTATKKDTSKGSCCPVAVGNALRDMHKEIQEIICACNEGASSTLEPGIEAVIEEAFWKRNLKPTSGNPWRGITTTPDGTVIHDCVLRQAPDNINPISVTYPPEPIKTSSNSLEECPQCHERTLIHTAGCLQCNSCGYSKCS